MSEIVLAQQFAGPPKSGNGGYVCGLLARGLKGPVTAVLRAPAFIGAPLKLTQFGDGLRLETPEGDLVGEGRPADAEIPTPPAPPSWAAAEAAAKGFPGLHRPFHPVCFCCGDQMAEGYGLRVFTGQVEGAPAGHVAGTWIPHEAFADADGLVPLEVVWAALDCPGSVAWVVTEGGGGLLGTMTCEVLRRPHVGERLIVTAWPIEQQGRRRLSGTALFTETGELLARSHQVWIGRAPQTEGAGMASASAG
ncbi:MAG TPA: hypothetical protein VG939_21060 [Caulobacteraceae bacterium]|nr:hypothetical protein [Caulobacteraceae bacterium]